MQFTFAYAGESGVRADGERTRIGFAPDVRRKPTFFSGRLTSPIAFREAAGALHDVVISDRKFKPKDKAAWLQWKQAQRQRISAEYWKSRTAYMDYLYKADREAWMVLDPVITVHPDEIFFEAFSKDESAYARLSVEHTAFSDVREFACGTTNIDFSGRLYGEFQRIRSRKPTWFEIDAGGFSVQRAGGAAYREKKIDVPESWVRGFLQVQSAMTLPAASFVLRPMDLYNLCLFLRRNREKKSPRSIRWELRPDAPVEAVLEPWEARFTFPGSKWLGEAPGAGGEGALNPATAMGLAKSEIRADKLIIRTWGRRRLHLLERLLPGADRVSVHLLGRGMPSFFIVHLGRFTFCLGLSGWTYNDWTASAAFDLMTARRAVDRVTLDRMLAVLRTDYSASIDGLAQRLGLDRGTAEAGLTQLCREGRCMYDWTARRYRLRELTAEPLPADHPAFGNEREQEAQNIIANKTFAVRTSRAVPGGLVESSAEIDPGRTGGSRTYKPAAFFDLDGRMVRGECDCFWHKQNRLRQGPCGHLLALAVLHAKENPN